MSPVSPTGSCQQCVTNSADILKRVSQRKTNSQLCPAIIDISGAGGHLASDKLIPMLKVLGHGTQAPPDFAARSHVTPSQIAKAVVLHASDDSSSIAAAELFCGEDDEKKRKKNDDG